MSFLIYAGYVFFLGFLQGGVCLEETIGEASDSLLQFLLKRTQEQDSKIAALEAKMMKDHSELSDRISFLEAKVRRSESAQDMLENTIEDLHEIIQDLKMKTFVENSEALPPFDGIPAKTESNKVILVEEQRQKVESADKSVQRRILSGGGSTGKEEIMDNSFNLCIIYSHGCFWGVAIFHSRLVYFWGFFVSSSQLETFLLFCDI